MTMLRPVPLGLIEGFAEVWAQLAGGSWCAHDTANGTLVVYSDADGRRCALPDRMYGLGDARLPRLDPGDVPAGVTVNLPPGVQGPSAEVHAVGHILEATSRDVAWSALRRVGRQGVNKAQKLGCRPKGIEPHGYQGLAAAKAARFGAQAPHPGLFDAMRRVFGSDQVGLCGVEVDSEPVAAVLWLIVDDYGMLVDGASDPRHWDKNPNNLAVWSALGALVDRGCTIVDYGFSAPGAGDLRFKDHMGGRAVELYRLVGCGTERR